MRENINTLTFTDVFHPNMASNGFPPRLRNLLISQTASGTLKQVEQENMEDLSVEVCGKNGAYYKVRPRN